MAATHTTGRADTQRQREGSRRRPGQIVWTKRAKRGAAVIAAIVVGLVAGVALSLPDKFDRAILEVTLPLRHDDIIRQQARDKGVDPALIAAIIYAESRFHDQTSHAGARGLMQITPDTANDIERKSGGTTFRVKDLSDPQINIAYGTYFLRELLDRYGGNEVAALAAYNAGPTNADRWGGSVMTTDDIPTDETRGYVDDVLDKQTAYRDKYSKELGY